MRIAFLILGLISIAVYMQRGNIAMLVLPKAAERAMSVSVLDGLEDGLHVALCGAGGPMPDPRRSGPCVAVVAGDSLIVIDAGTGGARNLGRLRFPMGDLDALFLTHFHSDHIDGLGEMAMMRWVGGSHQVPLAVYGPEGVADVVAGFNTAYQRDAAYRNAHHGDEVAPMTGAGMLAHEFEVPLKGNSTVVFDAGGLTVEAIVVDHEPVRPAVAYLIRYKDRSALVSGDTAKSSNLEHFASGVDLLVHEALAPNLVNIMGDAADSVGDNELATIMHDILDYHATPVEAAEIARDAGVGHLLYYHIVPPLLVPGSEAAWLDGVNAIFEEYTVGVDGTMFSLPADSSEIFMSE